MFEIIRVEKTSNYTIISNHHLHDDHLSLKTKGLMTVMLSLPDKQWDLSIAGLATLTHEGQSSIRTCLTELEQHGYFKKKPIHRDGRIRGWEYTLIEVPKHEDLQVVENQHVERQVVEKQDVENRMQLNTNNNINTDFLNSSSSNPSSLTRNLNKNSYFNDPDLDNLFNEFLKIRKQLKAVNSELAIKKLVNKVYEYSKGNKEDAMEIISESIENSWKGIFPLKKKNSTGSAYMDAIKNRVNVVDDWVERAKREGLC